MKFRRFFCTFLSKKLNNLGLYWLKLKQSENICYGKNRPQYFVSRLRQP